MPVITLITDWQTTDYYSGMLKGRLLTMIPGAQVVDVNQNIPSFHSLQAAFVLRQVFAEFPAGTIHLFLVNQGHQSGIWPAAVSVQNQFLIGWDDGILGLIVDGQQEYYLKINREILARMDASTGIAERFLKIDPSFPELSVFPRIAAYISMGHQLKQAGEDNPGAKHSMQWLPVIQNGQIDGQVIFIDSYRNAITNIPKSEFDRISQGRPFEITIKSNRYKIFGINESYLESDPGELLALFNSAGLLEVAIAQGNAADLLGFETGTPIKIKFDEK